MKIIQIEPAEVWTLLFRGYEVNMIIQIDSDNVVYYLKGYNVDLVTSWIHDVLENRTTAAFFYLVGDYAAE